jgi:hypothetical protein
MSSPTFPLTTGGSGGSGTSDHTQLTNRTSANQHPGSSISLVTTGFDVNLSSADDTVQKAMDTLDDLVIIADAMIYKGSIDCSANPNYPAADAGNTYRVSAAGKIGGASGTSVTLGQILICNTDATSSGDQATVGAYWDIFEAGTTGAVIAPASTTENYIPQWDYVSGTLKDGKAIGTTTGTIAAGDDSRFTDARSPIISGLTAETSIADDDLVAIYDTSASANRKMTKANFVAGLGGGGTTVKVSSNDTTAGYLNGKLTAGAGVTLTEGSDGGNETLEISVSSPGDHWILESGSFTATPASTSTLTMTSDRTSIIKAGYGVRYTIGGVTYYGVITAMASNLMTIGGASMSGDVTALAYTKTGVVQMPILIPGYYEDATSSALLAEDLGQTLIWQQGPAYLVRALMYSRVVDSSSDGYANVRQGSAVIAGTAQAGDATHITLATAGSSADDDAYNNMWIKITGGTGSGQSRKITDYVGSSKVAQVATWVTNPSSDSTYEIYKPVINANTYSGLLLDTAAAKQTVIDIDTAKYGINYGDAISIMALKGTGGTALDLSIVLTYVVA